MDFTTYVAKTKALISFAVTAKLICVFVFAYAKSRFSHNEAHIKTSNRENHNRTTAFERSVINYWGRGSIDFTAPTSLTSEGDVGAVNSIEPLPKGSASEVVQSF